MDVQSAPSTHAQVGVAAHAGGTATQVGSGSAGHPGHPGRQFSGVGIAGHSPGAFGVRQTCVPTVQRSVGPQGNCAAVASPPAASAPASLAASAPASLAASAPASLAASPDTADVPHPTTPNTIAPQSARTTIRQC
jgi:hypothetical protein